MLLRGGQRHPISKRPTCQGGGAGKQNRRGGEQRGEKRKRGPRITTGGLLAVSASGNLGKTGRPRSEVKQKLQGKVKRAKGPGRATGAK